MNTKGSGSVAGWIVWALLVVTILAIILVNITSLGLGFDITEAPDSARAVVETAIGIAQPVVELVFFIVAPVGEDDNVQMIAFSIFLLLTLVGTKTLNFAFTKQPFLAFFVSAIVGIIAARSLTSTVLRDTALGASPLATASLLLGFIPIYALTRNLDRWSLTNLSKMVVYTVVAAVYVIIFWVAFSAKELGLVYGIGIIVMGAGEAIFKAMAPALKEKENKRVGRFIAWAGQVEKTAKEMEAGSRR